MLVYCLSPQRCEVTCAQPEWNQEHLVLSFSLVVSGVYKSGRRTYFFTRDFCSPAVIFSLSLTCLVPQALVGLPKQIGSNCKKINKWSAEHYWEALSKSLLFSYGLIWFVCQNVATTKTSIIEQVTWSVVLGDQQWPCGWEKNIFSFWAVGATSVLLELQQSKLKPH